MKPRKHKYANSYADGGEVRRTPPKPPAQQPKPRVERNANGDPRMKADSAADALRNQRARQMKELGLKDGGKVRRKC